MYYKLTYKEHCIIVSIEYLQNFYPMSWYALYVIVSVHACVSSSGSSVEKNSSVEWDFFERMVVFKDIKGE